MSYQTIVAAFDTAAHAQAAVEALKTGGFHSDDISMFDKSRVGMREPGLWNRIFGGGLAQHEADVYSQSLERGGVVLSVRVPDSEVAHATGILDMHRPIDVHDRAVTTGIAPAARVEAAAAAIATTPIAAVQTVAVSPKLAEAHDEVLRLAEEQLQVGKRMVEAGTTRVRRFVTEKDVSADVTLHESRSAAVLASGAGQVWLGNSVWQAPNVEISRIKSWASITAVSFHRDGGESLWRGDRHRIVVSADSIPPTSFQVEQGPTRQIPLAAPPTISFYPAGLTLRIVHPGARFAQALWDTDFIPACCRSWGRQYPGSNS
jgi:Domain of unknown function (DUF2382)